jgi:hypothetical protein
VLSPESDSFYKQNMYANFGDLGVAIKQLVDEYQDKSKGNTNIQTIGILYFLFLFPLPSPRNVLILVSSEFLSNN